jgi:hypothetical protein
MKIKDKYYVYALEVLQIMVHLAENVESIYELFRKHKSFLQPEMVDFLNKDPIICLNQMQWIPSIPRNSVTLNLSEKMITEEVEYMLRLNIQDKKDKLMKIFESNETPNFSSMLLTLIDASYYPGDRISFFSEKYKDWINAKVNQIIYNRATQEGWTRGNEVIYIDCDISNKNNSPIFAFKEIIESLDKQFFGDSQVEIETNAYFNRLFKLISIEL